MKIKYTLKKLIATIARCKPTRNYMNLDQHNHASHLYQQHPCHLLELKRLVPVLLTITPTVIVLQNQQLEIKLARDMEYYITNDVIIFATVSKKYVVAVSKRQCICIHKILLNL